VAVVDAFYGAITAGDASAAMRLIAPDAVFVESGKIETRVQYEENHLPADIEFESNVKAMRGPLRVTFDGRDTAWVISSAEYDEGNPEKYINTQLMVLTRDTGDWRIRTISWSSNQP
jgi:ketosteroid isomerase-like protein